MTNQLQNPHDSPSRPRWLGAALAAAILLVAVVWAYSARSAGESGSDTVQTPSPAADAAALDGFRADAWFLPDDALLGFVEVPAGPFTMGSDKAIDPMAFDNERWSSAQAQGIVDVPAFYISRYEVTVGQFMAFAEATGRRAGDEALRAPLNHPIAAVSWPDALAYCRWLETKLKDARATPSPIAERLREGWRITLPSEAEWEKAARGTDGRIFPWGNAPRRDRANYAAAATTAVGQFECPECPFGLEDMSGNVWEWTRSPYQPYPYDPADDRKGLEADALWVIRGGSFGDDARNVRAAIRGGADPGVRRPFIGFRLVIARY